MFAISALTRAGCEQLIHAIEHHLAAARRAAHPEDFAGADRSPDDGAGTDPDDPRFARAADPREA